jgi:hypothetical protein
MMDGEEVCALFRSDIDLLTFAGSLNVHLLRLQESHLPVVSILPTYRPLGSTSRCVATRQVSKSSTLAWPREESCLDIIY